MLANWAVTVSYTFCRRTEQQCACPPAGELSSDDDFYLLAPSGLAVLQTTNSVFNRTLYQRLTPQVTLLEVLLEVAELSRRSAWPATACRVGLSFERCLSPNFLLCACLLHRAERAELAAGPRRQPAGRQRPRMDKRDCAAQQRHRQQPVDGAGGWVAWQPCKS